MSRLEGDRLGPPRRRDGSTGFDEPWQAEALALAYSLVERGVFSAGDWSAALGDELRRAEARGDPDTPSTYYAAAVAALGRLTAAAGAVAPGALDERTEAWRDAYLHTPHGQPVELRMGPAAREPIR